MTRFRPLISMIALLVSCAAGSFAAVDDLYEQLEDASATPLDLERKPLSQRKYPPIRLTLDEDITWGNFSGTDVTMFRTKLNAQVILPFSKRFVTSLSSYGAMTYTDFDGENDFINLGQTVGQPPGEATGEPWNNLYDFSLRLKGRYGIDDHWGVVFGAWTTSRFEQGASFSDGTKGAGALGLSYQFGERLTVSAGVAVSSRIVGSSPGVNPFGSFAWKIDETHELATSGLGLRLRSIWNKEITTYVYGRFKGRRWRIDDREDGLVNKGTLRDRQAPIGVGVRWKFWKGWRLRGDIGLLVYRQLTVTDQDDDTVDKEESNLPGVYGSLLLQRRF